VAFRIFFYIPEGALSGPLPQGWSDSWDAIHDGYGLTYLMYFALRTQGLEAELVHELPQSGIVVGHSCCFQGINRPSLDLYIICLQYDWRRNAWAQAHITANQWQTTPSALTLPQRLACPGKRYHLIHMPQLGLIPRSKSRGVRFETLSYFGLARNLSPEFQTEVWKTELRQLGLDFKIHDQPGKWKDYSGTDAVLAIRSPELVKDKPAQKLYNAWHAGTIAILGAEIGFREERESDLDYLEATNPEQVLAAVRRLLESAELRQAMMDNGFQRAKTRTPELIAEQWANAFRSEILPHAATWLQKPAIGRRAYLAIRAIRKDMAKLRRR